MLGNYSKVVCFLLILPFGHRVDPKTVQNNIVYLEYKAIFVQILGITLQKIIVIIALRSIGY